VGILTNEIDILA